MSDPRHSMASVLRLLPPDAAHGLALRALRWGLVPPPKDFQDEVLASRIWGLNFANPIGLAAGFDKDAVALEGLLGLGFGFIEAGTVTPEPQAANPKPHLFRLIPDRAIINRLGFPSEGLAGFKSRLQARSRNSPGIVGANVSRNRTSTDSTGDFARGAGDLAGLADYLVINVSSPNTPGLRDLQGADHLARLVKRVREAAPSPQPLLIKIAPDLEDARMGEIVELSLAEGVDGLIMGNTTLRRPDSLQSSLKDEVGGLSGPALRQRATAAVAELSRLAGGRLVLIGCGGVSSGADAYAMIRAGASLVQVYTALIYLGPGLINRIKAELAALLKGDGFSAVGDAVGADQC